MQDEILNKLEIIRATGKAKVNVHSQSIMSKYNGKVFTVYDIGVNGDKPRVSLNINGVITDFIPGEVEEISHVYYPLI